MTREINASKIYKWHQCENAHSYTEEPKGLGALYHQLTRWDYGDYQLRAKKNLVHKYAPFMLYAALAVVIYYALVEPWIRIGLITSMPIYVGALVILVVLGINILATRSIRPGVLLYSVVESCAEFNAIFNILTGRKPKWEVV